MKSTLNFLSLSPILSSSSKHPFANPNFQTMSIISPCKPFQNAKASSTTFPFPTFLSPPPISIYNTKLSFKLDQENFLIRRQLIEPVIKRRRLDRFLSADSVNGGNADSNKDDFDELVFWFFSALSVSILTQFYFLPVRAKARQYRSDRNNITKNSTELVSEYVFRIKILIESLAVANRPVKLQEHVDAILLGLPEEYEGVVIFICAISISMDHTFTVEQIEFMVLVYEDWIDDGS